jgi:5'-3' exoribonuclease 2
MCLFFVTNASAHDARPRITTHYVEGLAWVLTYYYQGVRLHLQLNHCTVANVPETQTPSWQWYYPYHFAPFAVDFEEVRAMDIRFDLGKPFQPFEQLMGVFPASRLVHVCTCDRCVDVRFGSRQHIPAVFHSLMTDEDSPIIDFYPTSFEIDMNGKRMAWQGVALLPFIDQKRLLDAMAAHYPKLTEDEVRRNTWGNNAIFTSEKHSLYPSLEALYGKKKKQDVSCLSDSRCICHDKPFSRFPSMSRLAGASVGACCRIQTAYLAPLTTALLSSKASPI